MVIGLRVLARRPSRPALLSLVLRGSSASGSRWTPVKSRFKRGPQPSLRILKSMDLFVTWNLDSVVRFIAIERMSVCEQRVALPLQFLKGRVRSSLIGDCRSIYLSCSSTSKAFTNIARG